MVHGVVTAVLAAVLAAAAVLKLAAPRRSAAALETFGVRPAGLRRVLWGAVCAVELGLAAGVALGIDAAAWAAAGLLAAFAAAVGAALARGRRGAPCGCFGARSTIGPAALARALVLAGALAALPWLPRGSAPAAAWLGLGLGVCLVAIAALAVAVLALAREVGVLRLALGPQQALEIPGEGPPVGDPLPELAALAGDGAPLALAVFSSEGCRLCQAVRPAVDLLARDEDLAVVVLDEVRDAPAWRAAAAPGSPYAVALDTSTAVVLAKGTFNGLGQLESVVATARRRAAERLVAEAVGA